MGSMNGTPKALVIVPWTICSEIPNEKEYNMTARKGVNNGEGNGNWNRSYGKDCQRVSIRHDNISEGDAEKGMINGYV